MQRTRAQLVALLNSKILTSGNRTTAQNIRDFENAIIESLLNIIDDADQPGGFQTYPGGGGAFVPLSGTATGQPLTGIIEFLNAYSTAIGSLSAFYIGSGNDIDIQNANAYNTVLFETPVAGQSNQIYLNNQQSTWTTRKGSSNAGIIKFADPAGTYIRIRTYDGTDFGEVVFTPFGATGSSVFTPTQDEDFIQKGYADTVYLPKTKVAGSGVVAGGEITLPNTPSFTYLVHGNGNIYEEGDDYTRAGAVLTFTNPSVSDGDKIYYKYEY